MKRSSRKTERSRRGDAPVNGFRNSVDDQVLAILVDERNGREYYVSIIDVFTLDGRTYSVMYNYEPDDGSRSDPEIVCALMERRRGEQAFHRLQAEKNSPRIYFFFERYIDSIIRLRVSATGTLDGKGHIAMTTGMINQAGCSRTRRKPKKGWHIQSAELLSSPFYDSAFSRSEYDGLCPVFLNPSPLRRKRFRRAGSGRHRVHD